MKPVLKWCGGKARLAPTIAATLGYCEGTYFEPFLGGGAVFLYLKARGLIDKAVLADANPKLMNVYRALRDDYAGLMAELDTLAQTVGDDWKDYYYPIRVCFNDKPPNFEVPSPATTRYAALLLWLNRACFNGLYRENRSGKFNVPVGSYKALNFPSPAAFLEVSTALQGVELLAQGFDVTMALPRRGDVVYCDPPYVPLGVDGGFTSYTRDGFTLDDQRSLAWWAGEAAGKGARVVLSNHDLPIVRELYEGFELTSLQAARSISAGGSSRGKVGEVLAVAG